jgi:hypothetical protein
VYVVIYSSIAILQSYNALYKLTDSCPYNFFLTNQHQDCVKNSPASIWYLLIFCLVSPYSCVTVERTGPKNMHITNFVIVKMQTMWYGWLTKQCQNLCMQNEGSCFYHYFRGGVGTQDCHYFGTVFILLQ